MKRFISVSVKAPSNTATPPIQPVKPTLRELWMTRPIVNGPPLPSSAGVWRSCGYHHGFSRRATRSGDVSVNGERSPYA